MNLHQNNQSTNQSAHLTNQSIDSLPLSPQRFRTIVEVVPDTIVIIDSEGTILFLNRSEEGLPVESFIGTNIYTYVKPEMAESYKDSVKQVFLTGEPAQVEIQGKDGQILDCRGTPFEVDNHGVQRMLIILTDITERKKVEEQLEQINQRFRAIVENAPVQISVFDRNGTISFLNHAESGVKTEEIVGTSIFDHVKPETVKIYREIVTRVFETGESDHIEAISINDRIWDVYGTPLLIGGKVEELLVIVTDITDRKNAEQVLRQHKDQLENLVRERTKNLQEANTALRLMLKAADQVKNELEDTVMFNVKRFALPHIGELRKSILDDRQQAYLDLLDQSLDQITRPFLQGMTAQYLTLTPSEITVANLIKHGKSSKEIASLLNMSPKTVSNHRYSIRSKLGMDRKVNLRTYLSSLDIS